MATGPGPACSGSIRNRKKRPAKLCIKFAAAGTSTVILGACASTGTTEPNAAYGAAAGAVAGAVIGNNAGDGDAGQGAAIAAVVGGLGGATRGCIGSKDCDGHIDACDRYLNDRYRWQLSVSLN